MRIPLRLLPRSIAFAFSMAIAYVGAQALPQVAAPVANPPGLVFVSGLLQVSFSCATAGAGIYYTTDGSLPDTSGGGVTRLYAGPLALSATTTLKAIATKPDYLPSAVVSETYTRIFPLSITRSWLRDDDGDGRIERASVVFSAALPSLPRKFRFSLGESASIIREAEGGAISLAPGIPHRVEVVLSEPFPFGLTSLPDAATTGRSFANPDIPILEGDFPVNDSVPPVIVSARLGADAAGLARIAFTASEPVSMGADPSLSLVLKRRGPDGAAHSRFSKVVTGGALEYFAWVDDSASWLPAEGDSLGFLAGGNATDSHGNRPFRTVRIPIVAAAGLHRPPAARSGRFGLGKSTQAWLARTGSGKLVDANGARCSDGPRP